MTPMTTRDLRELLAGLTAKHIPALPAVGELRVDSRKVQKNDVFIALTDSPIYLHQAQQQGACAIIYDASFSVPLNDVLCIPVVTLAQQLPSLAVRRYGLPDPAMRTVAVTGTNGKSSCTHVIAQTLRALGERCGLLGTLGHGVFPDLSAPSLTTPDIFANYGLYQVFKQQQVKTVCLEASSHGLQQGRLQGIPIEIAVFTNLSRDHLDYHGSMQKYAAAKKRLFAWPGLKHAVINIDDPLGVELHAQHACHYPIIAYSQQSHAMANVQATQIQLTAQGIQAMLKTPWGNGDLHLPLFGRFNLANALASLSSLCLLGYSLEQVLDKFAKLNAVPGRMQRLAIENKQVILDFAHTPDALQQALQALRAHCRGRLICVFGCGGDRDKGKRPLMGHVAENYADITVLTSDNPRSEPLQEILHDIRAGFTHKQTLEIEPDRAQAIQRALSMATANDVVLLAGKGHEQYQLIGQQRIPFSDEAEVLRYAAEQNLGEH